MAKKKKKASAVGTEERAKADAPEPAQPQGQGFGVRLAGIVLRSLSYRELEGTVVDPKAIQSATNFNVEMSVNGNFAAADPTAVQLTLSVTIRPDPAVRPMEIDVVMSAGFVRDDSVSIRDFIAFISNSGGVIIFPYVRELVASITMRSPYGHVVLNPMRVGPILSAEGIESFSQELEAPNAGTSRTIVAV